MAHERVLPEFASLRLTTAMCRDLRSDHAGELGAVAIYHGMLQATRSDEVARFAKAHLNTEQRHLALLDAWLPQDWKSRLLFAWRGAGWSLGFVGGLFGPRFAYVTIAAVERFVVTHYEAQIAHAPPPLRDLLVALQQDEQAHRQDALARLKVNSRQRSGHRLWSWLVGAGSAAAVASARRI